MHTNDGSHGIVTVPGYKVGEFKEYAKMANSNPGMREYFNNESWNYHWKAMFGVSIKRLSDQQISVVGVLNSEWSRKAALEYWLNPTFANAAKVSFIEAASQWTNPELVITGLSAGVAGASAVGMLRREELKSQHMVQKGLQGLQLHVVTFFPWKESILQNL